MKKIISILIVFILISLTKVYAVDFDTSIDNDIRKNYKIEETPLPPLPEEAPDNPPEVKTPIYTPKGKNYTIKRGEKITLQTLSNISDRHGKGHIVSFKAINGIMTKEGEIIPAGTIFKGSVTDSHPPQISGNGGLIELKIDEIYYNGIMSKIKTKISLANSKKVFLSNIKGKRLYLKNISKAMTPGKKVFSATQNCTSAMSAIPIINLVSFVPITGGAVIYTVNLVMAPIISIFTKGKSISLPKGTLFVIKITEESQIRG